MFVCILLHRRHVMHSCQVRPSFSSRLICVRRQVLTLQVRGVTKSSNREEHASITNLAARSNPGILRALFESCRDGRADSRLHVMALEAQEGGGATDGVAASWHCGMLSRPCPTGKLWCLVSPLLAREKVVTFTSI